MLGILKNFSQRLLVLMYRGEITVNFARIHWPTATTIFKSGAVQQ